MMRRLFRNGFYLVYTGVALLTAGFFLGWLNNNVVSLVAIICIVTGIVIYTKG